MSLAIWEMQIKIIMMYHYTLTRMIEIKKTDYIEHSQERFRAGTLIPLLGVSLKEKESTYTYKDFFECTQ